MTDHPFPPEVVEALLRHMNDDHAADSLLICQQLGEQPDATAARMTGIEGAAVRFSAAVDGDEVEVRLETAPLTERVVIRNEIVRLFQEACARAAIDPLTRNANPTHPAPAEEHH